MADEEKTEATRLAFPTGRVKKIMKLDNEINKVNSEALFLVSRSAELFIRFLAQKSAEVALEKKRKTVNLHHLRIAVKRHQPTSDFLLDSLPVPAPSQDQQSKTDGARSRTVADKPVPKGTRRIDHIFHKPENEVSAEIDGS